VPAGSIIFLSRFLSSLALALLLTTTAGKPAPTDIVVRFLNPKSGKPLTKVGILVLLWNESQSNGNSEKPPSHLSLKTDEHGEIHIHLNDPLPSRVTLSNSVQLAGCSELVFDVLEAIRSGVVAKFDVNRKWCGQLKARPTAKPGEIVVFDKKVWLFD
jgi:hypothetical protein